MATLSKRYHIEILSSLQDLRRTDWEELNGEEFPFIDYRFLTALEVTKCLGTRTGWQPLYLAAYADQQLCGAMALFVKTNSYGEYIFDFAWAQAAENAGIAYYPKLVSAVPFTPATGPKILLSRKLLPAQKAEVSQGLLQAALELGPKWQASSLHALFITPGERETFKAAGFFIRHSFQFHWRNHNYQSFDDFLAALKGKRRREILRERAQVATGEFKIQRLTGDALLPEHADMMHSFYLSTIDKMNGFDYLTRDFFKQIFTTMREKILFVLATKNGEAVAGALNFLGEKTLFGRQWGCLDEYKSLHFELCYYQGIEFAIEKKWDLFEAGAQGEHKFTRGFLPSLTYSAHQIADPRLDAAVRDFVGHEARELEKVFADYAEHSPFQVGSKIT